MRRARGWQAVRTTATHHNSRDDPEGEVDRHHHEHPEAAHASVEEFELQDHGHDARAHHRPGLPVQEALALLEQRGLEQLDRCLGQLMSAHDVSWSEPQQR